MVSKQTLIGGTAAALVLAASITTASAQERHGMSGSVGGNQSVGANVGANGARGAEQTQLSQGARNPARVHGSSESRDLGSSARLNQRADIRGRRDVGTTYGSRTYARSAGVGRNRVGADIRGRRVGTTYGTRVYGRSADVEQDRVGYGAQYARSGYAQGYDRDWRYGGADYGIASGGFGYGPDYAYAGYGGPYYDYAPGYAAPGFGVGVYAPGGFGVGVGFTPAYGGF